MAELDQLLLASMKNRKAAGQLAGLDEQYDRATALRDSPQPGINKYGTVSPLAIIGNSMRQARGQKQLRGLEKTRAQARDDIATGEAAVEGLGLRETMQGMGLARNKDDREAQKVIDDAAQLEITNKIAADEETRAERESGAGSGDEFTFSNGKNKIPVTTNSMGEFVAAADNEVAGVKAGDPIPDGYTEVEDSSGTSYTGTGIKSVALRELSDSSNQLRKFKGVVEDFEPRFTQIGGVKTTILNDAIATLSSEDLLEYVASEEMTKDARDSMHWWANLKMIYELPERYKLFGATLTNNEAASWKEAMAIIKALPPEELEKRLNKLYQGLGEDYVTKVGAYGRQYANHPGSTKSIDYMAKRSGMERDEETNDWMMPDATPRYRAGKEEAPPAGALPLATAPPPPAPPTPEEAMAYGEIVMGFTEEERADFTKQPPDVQLELLKILRGNNGMVQ